MSFVIDKNGEYLPVLGETSGGGGGSTITVDSTLSNSSENPVQNKVINSALEGKANTSLDNITTSGEGVIMSTTAVSTTYVEYIPDSTDNNVEYFTPTKNGVLSLVYLGQSDNYIQIQGKSTSPAPWQRAYVRGNDAAFLVYPCTKGVTYEITLNGTLTKHQARYYYLEGEN